nr:hypothetical protein [Serratia marcescens]
MPKEVLEKSVDMPAGVFKAKQGRGLYCRRRRSAPHCRLPKSDGGLNNAPLTHRYELMKQKAVL